MMELRKAFHDSKAGSKITLRDWSDVPGRQDVKYFRTYRVSHYQDAWYKIVRRNCGRHLAVESDGSVAISSIASE
jgi:hypothetical protein